MIPVARKPTPDVLRRYGAKWLTKLQDARSNLIDAENNLSTIKLDPSKTSDEINAAKRQVDQAKKSLKLATVKYRHKVIKDTLVDMFSGKCAYCESKIPHVSYGAIEHFHPKSVSAFEHLTFEWLNLLLSCDICNDGGHKGINFPVDINGDPLLIDPTDGVTDPNDHLDFSWDRVSGLASIYGRDDKGKAVEATFELNRKELLERRSNYVKKLVVILEYAQGGNTQALNILYEGCDEKSEYSAFSKLHIKPYLP